MEPQGKIVVILGPTASGKSDMAVKIAKKFNGEVISADSRQVYKGMDIGTGKITPKEMQGVPHYLLDVTSPKKIFNASEFVKHGQIAAQKITAKNKLPIICGGTGFYIDALLGKGQLAEVPPNPKLRKELEKKTADQLFKILQKLNPVRAQNIDAKNPRRLIRAIEIAKAPFKSEAQNSKSETNLEILKIGIKKEEKQLKKDIAKRIKAMVDGGLITETKKLHASGLSWKRLNEMGFEYKYPAMFLQGKIEKKKMLEEMILANWHYAQRQMTWFKRDKNIIWLNPKELPKAEKLIRKFI